MEKLKEKIEEIIEKYSGKVAVIVKKDSGEEIKINESEIFPSASLIKLFILISLEEKDFNRELEIKKEMKVGGCGVLKTLSDVTKLTIRDLASLMICFSDNTATNILIDHLGVDRINQVIEEYGFKGTLLGRKMFDEKAKKEGKDNFTTAEDVLKVTELLCKKENFLDMLLKQGNNNKIPLYFIREDGVKFAHKTGELKFVEHDAGRLFYRDRWVDIVILTKNLKSNEDGIRINSEIGKEIFKALLFQ